MTCFLFPFLMQDELPRRRVVIDDAYPMFGLIKLIQEAKQRIDATAGD